MAGRACLATICATRTRFLADHGYRVVAFDQLGCGASDRPDDASLWTIGRYVEETEAVRRRRSGSARCICSAIAGAAGSPSNMR